MNVYLLMPFGALEKIELSENSNSMSQYKLQVPKVEYRFGTSFKVEITNTKLH
jgi:hypothetical protein